MNALTSTYPARSIISGIALAAGLALAAPAFADDSDIWKGLQKDVFQSREILDGTGMLTLDAPIRAEDAAVVPLAVKMPASFAAKVTKLTLVVDKNPSPVVGAFTYGAAAGKGDRMLSTRIRMDQYSDVRAIAETSDGKLYMVSRFVKASGGCSAPASGTEGRCRASCRRSSQRPPGPASDRPRSPARRRTAGRLCYCPPRFHEASGKPCAWKSIQEAVISNAIEPKRANRTG